MIGIDALESSSDFNMGFIGAYGHRYANFSIAKSDLIISMGTRLDCRQTGVNLQLFAENAEILRIDIDASEMTNKINEKEVQYRCDLKDLIPSLIDLVSEIQHEDYSEWLNVCNKLKRELSGIDGQISNDIIRKASSLLPENAVITTDVGQNQVWVAQSLQVKSDQTVLFSGGHGAMGYSLPASIGAYYAHRGPVISFSGDGGIQMNIQELQFVAREKIPIKIFIINNKSLGMIRHFQEMYFDSNEIQTVEGKGYSAPDFEKISQAYGIAYEKISELDSSIDIESRILDSEPRVFEVNITQPTYVFPKLSMGKPIHNQDPLLEADYFDKLMKM